MAREMKDSGIEWIGEIPKEWDIKRLKALFLERKEKNDPVKTDFILSLGAAYGVVPYSEKEGGGNKAKEDLTDYRLAYPNDIVMNSMNIISGSVGISKYFGCVSPVYYMLYPRYENIDANFYCYLFQTKAFQRSLLGLGNGILIKESSNGNFNTVRMRIPMEKLGVQLLPTPSLPEQEKIATFLDSECARIDEVISKTKSTIEEYKKLKQSVITEAVTKGIRPNREMKDSGIEWIGEIPKEWDLIPLQYFVDLNKEVLGENTQVDYEFEYVEIGSVTLANGINEYQRYKFGDAPSRARRIVHKNDIIVSTVRTYLKAIAIVPDKENVIVSTGFAVLTPKNIFTSYLGWALKSEYFVNMVSSNSVGISYPAINASDLIKFKITIPNNDEQKEIANYLDEKCTEIDTLITKKEQIISELESYKKSLIYEYVTGKKEV